MNIKSLITIATISIFLLSGHAVVASAGTKSSPVQSEIKQLDAVKKSLNKINDRLLKILANPPDDTMPSPNVNGAVGRLGAMYHHLQILNGFIDSSLEVLGNPPSDSEGMTALEGVGGAAQRISGNVDEYLEKATTSQEFNTAIEDVKAMADDIVSKSTSNPACSSYTIEADCEADDNCEWAQIGPMTGECRDRIE
jgi:hypothetical protein